MEKNDFYFITCACVTVNGNKYLPLTEPGKYLLLLTVTQSHSIDYVLSLQKIDKIQDIRKTVLPQTSQKIPLLKIDI